MISKILLKVCRIVSIFTELWFYVRTICTVQLRYFRL